MGGGDCESQAEEGSHVTCRDAASRRGKLPSSRSHWLRDTACSPRTQRPRNYISLFFFFDQNIEIKSTFSHTWMSKCRPHWPLQCFCSRVSCVFGHSLLKVLHSFFLKTFFFLCAWWCTCINDEWKHLDFSMNTQATSFYTLPNQLQFNPRGVKNNFFLSILLLVLEYYRKWLDITSEWR